MKWYSIIEQFTTGKLTRQNSMASTASPASIPTSPVVVGETIPEEKPVAQDTAVAAAIVDENKPVAPPIDTKAGPSTAATASAPASAKAAKSEPTTATSEKGEKSHKKFGLFGRG